MWRIMVGWKERHFYEKVLTIIHKKIGDMYQRKWVTQGDENIEQRKEQLLLVLMRTTRT